MRVSPENPNDNFEPSEPTRTFAPVAVIGLLLGVNYGFCFNADNGNLKEANLVVLQQMG
jgi:hypothetical protein